MRLITKAVLRETNNYRRKSLIRPVCLRLDQSVQEPSALSSQSCKASDCHCIKMFHRLDQICELQWLSEERQIWLPMAGGSCTGWSNLRYIGRIYDFRRYCRYAFEIRCQSFFFDFSTLTQMDFFN